jgi:hypothetical protein
MQLEKKKQRKGVSPKRCHLPASLQGTKTQKNNIMTKFLFGIAPKFNVRSST